MTPQAPMPPGPPGGAADREWTENEQAIANGVFGAPFVRVDDEPFWGSDPLNDVAGRLAA